MSPELFDLVLIALCVFGFVWGWWRGFLSQFWGLVLVLVAFEAANRLGPVLEPVLAQVADPAPDARPGAAWTCAFLLVVTTAWVLLRAFRLRIASPAFPRLASRVGGALLSGFRGALLLMLASYVFLEAVLPPAEAARLGAGSRVLAWLPPARRRLTDLLRLPAPIQAHARAIEGWLRNSS